MSNWSLYNGDNSDWKAQVSLLDTATYLHDNEWAENLKNLGWTVCRWHYEENEQSSAFLQGFLKRYPFGVGILWFPDWIVGNYKLSHNVTDILRKSLSLRFLTIFIRSHHQKNDQELKFLESAFTLTSTPFGNSMTMYLDLSI